MPQPGDRIPFGTAGRPDTWLGKGQLFEGLVGVTPLETGQGADWHLLMPKRSP